MRVQPGVDAVDDFLVAGAADGAEASFELLVRRTLAGYTAPFSLEDFQSVKRRRHLAGTGSREQN